jgi:hypothetical protein
MGFWTSNDTKSEKFKIKKKEKKKKKNGCFVHHAKGRYLDDKHCYDPREKTN